MSNDEQNEIYFNFGDLVRCDGIWPRVFRVDSYHVDKWYYPNETWTETVYELVDTHTGELLKADVDDLTLVETADKAEEYIAKNPAPTEYPKSFAILMKGEETMAKPERKPTARDLSAQEADERGEQIDNLLDLRIWAADMLAKTGNEEFGDRIFAIDCELKELTESE